MVNKRGFLRVIEASIAVIAIMSVLFFVFSRSHVVETFDYSTRAVDILDEASKNQTIRNEILLDDNTSLTDFVSDKIPEDFLLHEFRICDIDDVCGQGSFVNGEVFSAERVISSNITLLNPRKVKVFIWRNLA